MKTANERAMDILVAALDGDLSVGAKRRIVDSVLADKSTDGESMRRLVGAIERGIEADRKDCRVRLVSSR